MINSNGYANLTIKAHVVGSISELEEWRVRGIAQRRIPDAYPTLSKPISLPSNTTVEWKCVKAYEDSLSISKWDPGSNSVLSIGTSTVTTLGHF